MFVMDDNLAEVIKSIYFDILVNTITNHGISLAFARAIATDFFDIMCDY